jgi:hypothetical protein
VVEGWRRLHNEELHNFYTSPNNIRVIKSRRRGAGHAARMREMRNTYKVLSGTEGKIILDWILEKWMGRCGLDSTGTG